MPINDPIRGKKIAPASLAFESRRSGGAGVSVSGESAVTYQNYISFTFGNTGKVITKREVMNLDQGVMHSVGNAERRAKHWVGDYERAFEWDISDDVTITVNAFDAVQFDHEVCRAMGAEFVGTVSTADAYWRYVCPAGAEGWYWVHSQVIYKFLVAMGISRMRLAFYINGIQWRNVDQIDRGYAGEAPIVDGKVSGGCMVPLGTGDELTVRVFSTSTGSGDQLLGFPTSVYGYVSGFRTRCDFGGTYEDADGATIDSPETGNTYNFT